MDCMLIPIAKSFINVPTSELTSKLVRTDCYSILSSNIVTGPEMLIATKTNQKHQLLKFRVNSIACGEFSLNDPNFFNTEISLAPILIVAEDFLAQKFWVLKNLGPLLKLGEFRVHLVY